MARLVEHAELESAGFALHSGSAAECDQRRVRGLALHHFMLEMNTLDDVGYTLDRHEETGTPIADLRFTALAS